MFRVVIVDDEPPARAKLRLLLADHPRFETVGESGGGVEAVALIERERPDLLLLDIHMPQMDGFSLLAALDLPSLPRVIFTTAYDQHALRAFEVHALDYLLKPFDKGRFATAMARAEAALSGPEDQSRTIRALLAEMAPKRYAKRLLLREGGRIFSVAVEEVIAITAEEKYVRIATAKRTYLHRESMSAMEAALDPARFARIHRSAIVSLDHFAHLEPTSHGDHVVVLDDGHRHRLGRQYREPFLARLEGKV